MRRAGLLYHHTTRRRYAASARARNAVGLRDVEQPAELDERLRIPRSFRRVVVGSGRATSAAGRHSMSIRGALVSGTWRGVRGREEISTRKKRSALHWRRRLLRRSCTVTHSLSTRRAAVSESRIKGETPINRRLNYQITSVLFG